MKNIEEELKNMKREYDQISVPEHGMEELKKAMEAAKRKKRRIQYQRQIKRIGFGMAAVFASAFLLTNVNTRAAEAMGKIPLLGKVFQVMTVRNYQYDDGHNVANVDVPEISTAKQTPAQETQENSAVEKVNKSVEEYTKELVSTFKKNMEATGEGYQGLDISYKVVTNTDSWFTLDIAAVETKASGYEFHRFYHIDKGTGKVVTLQNLFRDGSDYVTVISDEIKKQMKERMEKDENLIYWTEEEDPTDAFKKIDVNQNFYFDKDNNLVICFDEYAVAPGYMGTQEFTISRDLIKELLK
jgi:Protein of unknown function (DUF3298).